MVERLVVIGGDAAGMSAASQARRRRGPDELEIVAVERGDFTSYSACGIPYHVGGDVPELESLIARDPETFRRDYAIDVRTRTEAVEIDLDGRRVRLRELPDGPESWLGFDLLMVATGAVPRRPALPGADARGVFGVQTLNDGVALDSYIARERPARAVVVGGGYIGLEMAEAMIRRGLKVDLLEAGEQPMGTLDPDMGALVAGAVRGLGVGVHTGERVTGFDTSGDRVTAVRTAAAVYPADLVVLGLGVRPNGALAEAAGLTVGETGGVVVDRRMRTTAPGVWSAGDCVETFHRITGRPVAIALGTHANKQGRVAGIGIGGGYATFPGVIGTAVTKVCDIQVGRTGLNEREAERAGFAYVTASVASTTRAGYYPGATEMTTKVIAERRSGRLLGAQIVGEEGAAKRIDALAIAVWNEMTVEEMTGLDLGYAPPYSPVWDPVLITARKAAERLEAG
ncbi:MAG: flavoprotein oxidoreductase [Streptosporangiales bacterium]|nr:flavoprotein oxidoreductase [Streptosporangiales bacterium]